MSDNNSEPASQQPPAWLAATSDDFAATDINAPIKGAQTIDCLEASTVFAKAAEAAQEGQNHAQHRAYAMLGAITSFHFKPNEQHEPFGPMIRMQGQRSAQPSDFTKAMVGMLASHVDGISHHGVRARLSDLVWIVDRKQHKAAATAVASYSAVVQAITDNPAVLRHSGADRFSYEVPGFLQRAFQIGKAIGWERDEVASAKVQLQSLRVSAAEAATEYGYARLASLDLDYRVTAPATIAAEADARAKTASREARHTMLHIAARAYRAAKNPAECGRCLLEAADALVAVADANKHSAMSETHWLEKAIAELRRLPSAKEKMRALKHRLVDTQSRVLDEMQSFSHSTDISDVIEDTQNRISGKPLSTALVIFATITQSPDPKTLQDEARKLIAAHPLSSLADVTHYDRDGKPVHRTSGESAFAGDGMEAIEEQIAKSEAMRRSLVASGGIEPARQTLLIDYGVDEAVIALLCDYSAFVPADRRGLFASGLLHFMQGDVIAALHTLLPQVENSLRHVLSLHGHDVIKINGDMTQEAINLTQLYARLRPELETIFGAAVIKDIESLTIYRGGPQLRDRVTHGLIHEAEPFGPDALYLCWLVYRLVVIPLLGGWNGIAKAIEQMR